MFIKISQKRDIKIELIKKDKSIKFTHDVIGFDISKVCTLVGIYYDDEKYPTKEFFLENQKIKENVFIMKAEERKKTVRIKLETRWENNDLTKFRIECFNGG